MPSIFRPFGRRRLSCAAMVLAGLLGGPAAQAGLFDKDPPAPVVLKADSKADEAFRLLIDDGAALRHVSKAYAGPSSKVAIGMVKLNFVTDTADTARTQEFMGKATVSASAKMKLVGVTPEHMLAVANAYHAALRRHLAALGYEVVEQARLLEVEDFKKAVDDTKPVEQSSGGAVTTVYAAGTGNVMTFGMRNFAYNQKMPVVIANITINFAAFDKQTDRFAAGDKITASIESRAASTVGGFMRVMTEDGGGPQFDFVRALVLPGNFAEGIRKVEKSGGAVAAETGLRVLGALLGSRDSGSSETYEVLAAANYTTVLADDMNLLAGVTSHVLKKRE